MRADDGGELGRPSKGLQPGDGGPDRPIGTAPKFFLAVFQSSLRGSRIYRVYRARDSLLFVFVGPLVVFIDVETARRIDPTHWAIRAAGALKSGLVASVGGLIIVAAVLLRVVIRTGRHDPSLAWDLVTLLAATAVFAAVLIILAVTVSVRRITTRVAYLDALTEDELYEEAERNKLSFRATATDLSDMSLDRLEASGVLGARQGGTVTRLSFTHRGTGTWKLNLVKSKDAKTAIRALRRLLPVGALAANFPVDEE
jgi:hypothetical protein